MVSARFRADETSAKLTWMGLTADVRRQKTCRRRTTGSSFRGPRRRGAHHPGSERPWVSRTVAISQHVPPSRYPGSTTVIPSATVADLPNRQGPCLQNSSGGTPGPPDKRLSPVATLARKNWTFITIRAVTTRPSARHYHLGGDSTGSRP